MKHDQENIIFPQHFTQIILLLRFAVFIADSLLFCASLINVLPDLSSSYADYVDNSKKISEGLGCEIIRMFNLSTVCSWCILLMANH